MTLVQRFFLRFMRKLAQTPDGQRFIISQLVETEAMANGEDNMFPRLLRYAREPRLQKLIRRHYDDEIRHEQLYRDVIGRIDSEVEAPQRVMMMRILESLSRPSTALPVNSDDDMLDGYLFIQVLEEHAAVDLPLVARVFDDVDPVIAAVIREVAEDEMKHIRWCDPVLEAHARSTEELDRRRLRYRRLAEFAHHRHNLLGCDHAFRTGLVSGGRLVHWGWRLLISSHYVAWALYLRVVLGREARGFLRGRVGPTGEPSPAGTAAPVALA